MRVLGIDYGDSRVGVALSDPLLITSNSLGIVDAKAGRRSVVAKIVELIQKYDVSTVVVGYPVNMDGSKGPRVKVTEKFSRELGEACGTVHPVEIVFWDERLTTRMADRAMIEMNVHQRQKGVSDEIAAMLILQNYLDSRRSGV